MNLTRNQILAITLAVLGVLAGSATQLTDLFGANVAKTAVTASSLVQTILASILAVFTGQSSQVKDVLAMPGVEKLTVNAAANQTLAAIAVDPRVDKISPTQGDLSAVSETARGNNP
jgi:hypothetical protein